MDTHREEQCSVTVPQPFVFTELVHAVLSEFRELPGMRLTFEQAVRLFDADRDSVGRALNLLIDQHVLDRDRFGRYRLCGK